MAGLIQQQMGGPEQAQAQSAPPAQAMPPGGEAPQGAQEEQDEEPLNEDDPTFKSAIDFVMQALYSAQAAKDIAKQLKSAPDLQTGMADVAYNITAIADEKTQGSLADEYLAPLAMKVLEEVVEIADAAGLQPTPESVAIAFKTMILRYLQEQGVDTTQLDQAMSQIDPAQFGGMEEQQEEQAEV